jgi:hypothetical protein
MRNLERGSENRMIGTDSNHCRIVAESLAGERPVDEQTFASLAILDERLERLKKLDGAFSGVEFSSDVEKLRSQKNAVAVG